jgi:hypothetical protein
MPQGAPTYSLRWKDAVPKEYPTETVEIGTREAGCTDYLQASESPRNSAWTANTAKGGSERWVAPIEKAKGGSERWVAPIEKVPPTGGMGRERWVVPIEKATAPQKAGCADCPQTSNSPVISGMTANTAKGGWHRLQ